MTRCFRGQFPFTRCAQFCVMVMAMACAGRLAAKSAGVEVLHSFSGAPPNGLNPTAPVIQGSDGNFYGTAEHGGSAELGTVFKITPSGVLSTLYTFTGGAGGALPEAGLTLGNDGNFYGTTSGGRSGNGYGTVFKITPAGVLTTLHAFSGGADGRFPVAALTQGADGNFYSMTSAGGDSHGDGTIFKLTPAGVLTTLHTFSGGAGGAWPAAGLTQGNDGNFYGTTSYGGSGNGTVFKITPAGVFTVLYAFTGGADGVDPEAGLTLGNDGNFYGTTFGGADGGDGDGTVFKITPAGVLTTLHTFSGGADGSNPAAGLTQGNDGNFYGTTEYGGDSKEDGTIFKITPAGVLTALYTSSGGAGGASPQAGLTQGSDGSFYGTTCFGGDSNGDGTVFKITPAGGVTTLYTFGGAGGGASPAGLAQGNDGDFYGTTSGGGDSNEDGTIFKITPAGVLTTLYIFSGGSAGGAIPEAGLTQGSDGNFYGTTEYGGDSNGTVFKITPAGVLTTLYTFTPGADGGSPVAGLTQGSDGNFYGTTPGNLASTGDVHELVYGTVFKITPAGVLTTLYTFSGGAGGAGPAAGLTQGSDGNFYGTTYGDAYGDGDGTVFKITPAGVLTTLYTFSGRAGGSFPEAGLIKGSDGNFYGTTSRGGGADGHGTVFKITPAGVLTTLHTFTGSVDGSRPRAQLIQGSDGNFYGTTSRGGDSDGHGAIFKITPGGVLTTLYAFSGADGADPRTGLTQGSDGNLYGTTVGGGQYGSGVAYRLTLAPILPVVTLAATVPQAVLGSGEAGEFTLSLPAPQSADVLVNCTIKGSAINGVDYDVIRASKKIKAGETSKIIRIVPQGNLGGASQKVVTLVLKPGNGYKIGTTGKVKVKILSAPGQ